VQTTGVAPASGNGFTGASQCRLILQAEHQKDRDIMQVHQIINGRGKVQEGLIKPFLIKLKVSC